MLIKRSKNKRCILLFKKKILFFMILYDWKSFGFGGLEIINLNLLKSFIGPSASLKPLLKTDMEGSWVLNFDVTIQAKSEHSFITGYIFYNRNFEIFTITKENLKKKIIFFRFSLIFSFSSLNFIFVSLSTKIFFPKKRGVKHWLIRGLLKLIFRQRYKLKEPSHIEWNQPKPIIHFWS